MAQKEFRLFAQQGAGFDFAWGLPAGVASTRPGHLLKIFD